MTHAGLLLTRSPGNTIGKFPKPDEQRDPLRVHLEAIQKTAVPEGYDAFFKAWEGGLQQLPDVRHATLTSTTRTLIGHGLASTHQVGLSLHHTYGVPFLPGSALKGLTAHYVHAVLGASDARFRGPLLDDEGRVKSDPGPYFRAMFGAAPSETDREGFEGYVEFHDALVCIESQLFVVDVLTPHQSDYYSKAASDPNEFTSPIPVGFVTAKPGLRYRLFLSGPAEWTRLALNCLTEALAKRGIGGKTTSGYGRFTVEGGITEAEIAEAARVAAEAVVRDRQIEAQRLQRAERIEKILPELKQMAQGSFDLDTWKRLLDEARSFFDAGDKTLNEVVDACAQMAQASREDWKAAFGEEWPALTAELKQRWAGPPTTETAVKMWRWGRPGEARIQRADGARPEDVKAHAIAYGNGKLYQDRQYQIELPDKPPAEPNVIAILENGKKVIGVKKP